jgi:arabinofuranosyltransferase
MPLLRNDRLWFVAGSLLFVFCFFKIAWVHEDAYINFRSIEQLYAGNGPVWNAYERVQVYTSPLWYWLQAPLRSISSNLYLNVLFLSFIGCLLMLWFMWRMVQRGFAYFLLVLVLIACSGFMDYSSSGLENALAYLLVAAFVYVFFRQRDSSLVAQTCLIALVSITRHDLLTLLLIPFSYSLCTASVPLVRKCILCVLAVLPLLLWSLFALFYYGTPLPNTAYAKLYTTIPPMDIYWQGLKYLFESFRQDTIFAVVLIAALFLALIYRQSKAWVLMSGVLMNLAYVVYVGGDYMLGRFLSYAFLVSSLVVIFLLDNMADRLNKGVAFYCAISVALVLYSVFYPNTPMNTPLAYDRAIEEFLSAREHRLVADQRAVYARDLSLYIYMSDPSGRWFTESTACVRGRDIAERGDQAAVAMTGIGVSGYCAGVDAKIIDKHALSDPFLARIPFSPKGEWRTGHFARKIPAGYLDSVTQGKNLLVDSELRKLYATTRIVVSDPELFSMRRLEAIMRFNGISLD